MIRRDSSIDGHTAYPRVSDMLERFALAILTVSAGRPLIEAHRANGSTQPVLGVGNSLGKTITHSFFLFSYSSDLFI
jgi:hypothetical protein